MKTSELSEATQLVEKMKKLNTCLTNVSDQDCVKVSIHDAEQDAEMIAACKTSVIAELSRRRDAVVARLRELGITDV